MKKIYFTSDTHFLHKNIIKFSNRPFKDINHMTEEMVRLWNETVPHDGVVYHLGDFSLGSTSKTANILNRLNGEIHLIIGNHEKSVLSKEGNRNRFESIQPLKEIVVDKNMIVLCHYGMRVWNKSHFGSWHLYGHSHDSMEYEQWGRSMDVGVDSAFRILGEYRPFSYEEIKRIMNKRNHNPVDHHIEQKLKKKGLI